MYSVIQIQHFWIIYPIYITTRQKKQKKSKLHYHFMKKKNRKDI